MTKVIPAGAGTDDSYEVDTSMTGNGDVTFYRQKVPTPPVTIDKTTEGEVTIVTQRPDFPDDRA